MPHASIAGHQVYYELSGQGSEVLLLFNGITMSTAAWALMQPFLEQHYRLLRMDFLGQGQTDHPQTDKYLLRDQANLALGLLDHLHIEQVYLAGLSYGGMVAQHFAHLYPKRLKRLLLASTLAWSDQANAYIGDSWIAANAKGGLDLRYAVSIPWLFSSHYLASHADSLENLKTLSGLVDWPAVERLISGAREHDARTWLAQIHLPCQILVGDEDRLTPLYQANLLKTSIPKAQLEVLHGAGHVLHIEAAEAFVRSIWRFGQVVA